MGATIMTVQDATTCPSEDPVSLNIADLSNCYTDPTDQLYLVVEDGKVSMYTSDPGSTRPVPFATETCYQ